MIPWHPHTQPQSEHGVTAIVAINTGNATDTSVCKRWMILPGIYYWNADRGEWFSEQGEHRLTYREHWYCLEEDLLAHLDARAHLTENGHG